MNDGGKFFFMFFVVVMPCTIAALNPRSNLTIWMRLAALGTFVLFIFAIIRVYVLGVPEYKIFAF
jgi:hypothetical protein